MGSFKANSEIYGCIVFNNGFRNGFVGDGLTMQNEIGIRRIEDNIISYNDGGISAFSTISNSLGFHQRETLRQQR
ncbi:MAG: hypothetical protein R3C68_01750 [Myxococcota bacterium]